MASSAGATIDDDMGKIVMKKVMSTVVLQRVRLLQFFGFCESSRPSQVIRVLVDICACVHLPNSSHFV